VRVDNRGMDLLILTLAASATALATGLGAVPVFLMGSRAEVLRPILLGVSIGAMTVASLLGLLKPALEEGSVTSVILGFAAGALLLLAAQAVLTKRDVHVGELRSSNVRLSVLVFGVLFVHSLPEGLAIGTAFASDRAGLSLFVILAIALQNIPEGTAVALPMQAAGFSRKRQFWAAVLTSAPQPVGAVAAFLVVEEVHGLLPASFAFAAGAMLALVALELIPQVPLRRHGLGASLGTLSGAGAMLVLAATVGV
jgi:ZIP family zinc transporter